jgi:TrmH family RNA methyltransferase
MKQITSRTNPLYRSWKNLLAAKGIREEKSLLISGRKLVPEFIAAPDYRPQALIVSDPKDVEQLAFKKDLDVFWLAKDLFKELDESGTYFPLLVVEAPPLAEATFNSAPKGLEVLLTLSNPQNLGAVLRSCEAFQARQVYLLKECAHPFLPKVIRSSSGSSLRVPLQLGPSIQNLPESVSSTLTALDMHGENLATTQIEKNIRLLIGEEGQGVPKNLKFHKTLSIPIKKNMDSLNASVAASIALYAYRSMHA